MKKVYNLKKYLISFIFVGLFFITISLIYTFNNIDNKNYSLALMQAKSSFQKDLIFKQWVATNDNMYSVVTDKNKPSEFLSQSIFQCKKKRLKKLLRWWTKNG